MTLEEFKQRARAIRERILHMVHRGKSSHVGTALSVVEILTVLYFEIMNVDPSRPDDPDRDRFILSKGHGCTAQYATLCERGFFDEKILETYYLDGGALPGHATHATVPGVETSTGSLGHGLSLAVGMAYAAKLDKKAYRTFVVLGDGECNEGSVWEAAMAAAHWKLDNLVVIVDHNKLQGCGAPENVMGLEPFAAKWEAFGWNAREIDGHDPAALALALKNIPLVPGRPSVLIAHTIKGKGVSYMEGKVEWHYKSPDDAQLQVARGELNS